MPHFVPVASTLCLGLAYDHPTTLNIFPAAQLTEGADKVEIETMIRSQATAQLKRRRLDAALDAIDADAVLGVRESGDVERAIRHALAAEPGVDGHRLRTERERQLGLYPR
jgi:hypothetical protein